MIGLAIAFGIAMTAANYFIFYREQAGRARKSILGGVIAGVIFGVVINLIG